MNYRVTTYKRKGYKKSKKMQCTRRLRKEWSAKDATRTWICARCEKVTNQRLSYEGIFVYHWFSRSRENIIARAKPYLENKRRKWRHSEIVRPCEEIQRILASKFPVYCSAILFSVEVNWQNTPLSSIVLVCLKSFFRYNVRFSLSNMFISSKVA